LGILEKEESRMDKNEFFFKIIKDFTEQNKVIGKPFHRFFKDYKFLNKKGIIKDKSLLDKVDSINKNDLIILSPDYNKLNNMDSINKKIIFPFKKIFLEYPFLEFIIEDNKTFLHITDGFLIDTIVDEFGKIEAILFMSIFLDYGVNLSNLQEEGLTLRCILMSYDELNNEIKFDNNLSYEQKETSKKVINTMKKICYLIQRKEYTEYYKCINNNLEKKEIVFSQDVKSHRRHFWKDSGRFKIPLMKKDEWEKIGYGTDELVIRGYELRRDVPYKIIDTFEKGRKKEKNSSNRIINLLKKRNLKNEDKLGLIISEIFPDKFIKRHDRKILKGLELDFLIRDLRIAFEYDGEQHFDKKLCEEIFKSDFKELQKRDRLKDKLCNKKRIKLIRIKFDEPLTLKHIKNKISFIKCQ
jgi:hypothetical protein